MRVISKVKDYWDTAGVIDRSIIWVRPNNLIDYCDYRSYCSANFLTIGFCGQEYPLVIIEDWATAHSIERRIHYDLDATLQDPYVTGYGSRYFRLLHDIQEHFQRRPVSDEKFVQLNTPIFLARNEKIFPGNLLLKDFEFYRVKPAATAFQEVQTYLTNVLVRSKPIDEVDDKYKIAGHGFDKYSFRHPTKLK